MGIINVTPDSFSDGSQLRLQSSSSFQVDIAKALSRAEAMVSEGATFLDVGGESTRPGAELVPLQEELDRVIPVIEAIRANLDVCISIDTSSPEVMTEAINAGVELVNDIRALSHPQAIPVIEQSNVAVCLMHMQGEPENMQESISYTNVVEDVLTFLSDRIQFCKQRGIDTQRLIVDPGFGFGKTVQHNYQLLKNLSRLKQLSLPVLVGLSRKSMIGEVINRPAELRLAGSIAATSYALLGGAQIIRTHDVAATIDAIRVNSAFLQA